MSFGDVRLEGLYFLECFAVGIICGLVYNVIYIINRKIKIRIITNTIDILFFVFVSIMYFNMGLKAKFPNTRWYMPISTLLGMLLTMKTINKTLAKILEKVYNKRKTKKG